MIKENFKNIVRGICIGIILTFAFKLAGQKFDDMKIKEEFNDSFDMPKVTNDVKFKKKVIEKKYSFDYYGQKINIQDENLKVYGFDKNGNIKEEKLEDVVVEKLNTNIDFDNYISENEYKVYSYLQYKENIDTEYKIYSVFVKMRELSEELLKRENCKDRIEYLYNSSLLYIEPDSEYTIGNLKFSEINSSIQSDIKNEVLKIKYIVDNDKIKEETDIKKFEDNFSKILKYDLFNLGK